MLKEMKLLSPKSSTNSGKFKTLDTEGKLSGRFSPKTPKMLNTFQSKSSHDKLFTSPHYEGSLESTFYKTNRGILTSECKEDVVLENLKYFVANSPNIKTKFEDDQDSISKVVFNSKDYLSEKNALLDSIYHEDNFKNSQLKKKQRNLSQSSTSFFNFSKDKLNEDNGK
jgi:hypothetical protein